MRVGVCARTAHRESRSPYLRGPKSTKSPVGFGATGIASPVRALGGAATAWAFESPAFFVEPETPLGTTGKDELVVETTAIGAGGCADDDEGATVEGRDGADAETFSATDRSTVAGALENP